MRPKPARGHRGSDEAWAGRGTRIRARALGVWIFTSSATHATVGRWATECLASLRRRSSLPWGSSHGSAPYSLVGPGGLGFLAALPVLYCPGRDREPETQMRAPPRGSVASTRMQAGKLWPKDKKGCVDDTPEGPRLLGLQDQFDGTEGPSWEGPDRCPNPTSSPHSYLHARYAEEPILAIDTRGTLLRSRVEGRLTMRRCLGSGHPHMSLCDSCIVQVRSGSGHLAETHQPTGGREGKWEEDFGGWTTVLLLCGWQGSQIAARVR